MKVTNNCLLSKIVHIKHQATQHVELLGAFFFFRPC
jgi:hypothetical protein